jgi:hypothetical protein
MTDDIESKSILLYIKQLLGDYIPLEVSSIEEDIIKSELYKKDPMSFPKRRTKIVLDEGQYYIFVNTDLIVTLFMNIDDIWHIVKYHNDCKEDCKNCEKRIDKLKEYEKDYDGVLMDHYSGVICCDVIFPMSKETNYHLYVMKIDTNKGYCEIVYQMDTNEESDYKEKIEEIKRTKKVIGLDDFVFQRNVRYGKVIGDMVIVLDHNGNIIDEITAGLE